MKTAATVLETIGATPLVEISPRLNAGAALWAALELAKRPAFAGRTIVALLPDTGERYLSTDLFA